MSRNQQQQQQQQQQENKQNDHERKDVEEEEENWKEKLDRLELSNRERSRRSLMTSLDSNLLRNTLGGKEDEDDDDYLDFPHHLEELDGPYSETQPLSSLSMLLSQRDEKDSSSSAGGGLEMYQNNNSSSNGIVGSDNVEKDHNESDASLERFEDEPKADQLQLNLHRRQEDDGDDDEHNDNKERGGEEEQSRDSLAAGKNKDNDDDFSYIDDLDESNRTSPLYDIQFSNSIHKPHSEITDSSAHYSWIGSIEEEPTQLSDEDDDDDNNNNNNNNNKNTNKDNDDNNAQNDTNSHNDLDMPSSFDIYSNTTTSSFGPGSDPTHKRKVLRPSFACPRRHFRTLSTSPQTLLRGHTEQILSVDVSWDGSLIVTGSKDTNARVWDTATTECLAVLERVHSQPILGVALSNSTKTRRNGDASSHHDDDDDNDHDDHDPMNAPNGRQSYLRTVTSGLYNRISRMRRPSFHSGAGSANPGSEELLMGMETPVLVATASQDHTACLWIAQTGQVLHRLRGHSHRVHVVRWATSGSRGQQFVVTGSRDDTVRFWSITTGQCTQSIHARHFGVLSLDVAGDFLVTGGLDHAAKIWSVTSGALLHVIQGHNGWIQDVHWYTDETGNNDDDHNDHNDHHQTRLCNRIVTASRDQTAKIWRVHRQQILQRNANRTLQLSHNDEYDQADDDDLVADHQNDNQENDNKDKGELAAPVECLHTLQHPSGVNSISVSMDGHRVVTASQDQLLLHDTTTGQHLYTLPCGTAHHHHHYHHADDASKATTEAGRRPNKKRASRITTLSAGSSFNRSSTMVNGSEVFAVGMSGDGSVLVAPTDDATDTTAWIWNTSMGEMRYRFSEHKTPLKTVVMSRDGAHIVSASEDSMVCVWDTADATQKALHHHNNNDEDNNGPSPPKPFLTIPPHQGGGSTVSASVDITTDGRHIVTAVQQESCIRIWDASTGRQLRELPLPEGVVIHTVVGTRVVLLDNRETSVTRRRMNNKSVILMGGFDGYIRCCDADSGQFYYKVHTGGSIQSLVSNGSHIVTSSNIDATAHVWAVASGTHLSSCNGHDGPINDIAVASVVDGTVLVATASDDTTARLYQSNNNNRSASLDTLLVLRGHLDAIQCVAVSETSRVVTASRDKTCKVWNATDASCIVTLPLGDDHEVCSISLSADGTRLVKGSNDAIMRLWMLDSVVEGNWHRYDESAAPPSPLTVNDRFLAGVGDAHRNADQAWPWFQQADPAALSVALMTDLVHFRPSLHLPAQEKALLLRPDLATFENPLHLAVRYGNAAVEYFQTMLSLVPQEGVRKRHGLYDNRRLTSKEWLRPAESKQRFSSLYAAAAASDRDTDSSSRSPFGISGKKKGSHRRRRRYVEDDLWFVQDRPKRSLLMQTLHHGNEACLEVVLRLYRELLTPPSSNEDRLFVPSTKERATLRVFQGNTAELATKRGPHLADAIDVCELGMVARGYPVVYVNFVKSLVSVPNYIEANRDLPSLHMSAGDKFLLAGSEERLPKGRKAGSLTKSGAEVESFWKRYTDEQYRHSLVSPVVGVLRNLLLGSQESVALSVSAGIVPVKNIAGLGPDGKPSPFLQTLVGAASGLGDYSVFSNEVVKYVVQFKWETFVFRMFLRDALLFATLFVLFVAESVAFPSLARGSWTAIAMGSSLSIAVALLVAYFVKIEIDQLLRLGLTNYISDGWNIVSVSSLGMQIMSLAGRLVVVVRGTSGMFVVDTAHQVAAVTMPLLAFQALFFLRGLKGSGALVRMILRITGGIVTYCLILLVFIAAYSAAFQLMYPVQLSDDQGMDFTSYARSLLTVFGMLFGNYDQPMLDQALSPFLASVFLVSFLFLTGIILLNLLIAIMASIYDSVNQQAEAEAIFAQAQLVLEYEDRISDKQRLVHREKWYPTWLQVLKRGSSYEIEAKSTAAADNDNDNKMVAQQQQLHLRRLEQQLDQAVGQVREEVGQVQEEMKKLRTETSELVGKLSALVEAIQQQGGVPTQEG